MIKNKKQMFIVIGVFTLVMILGTVTYAFFNYTRTGSSNTIKVGDIYFNSSYDAVMLDGVFPIAKSTIGDDTDNVMSVNVDVEGHTTYVNGIYYEVKAEDVNLTVNGKNIPIGISVSSSNLNNVTLTNYEDGKVLTDGSLFANGRILASDSTHDNSVDGTITIKAYLDRDRIAISDTYNGLETDLMGTTNGWVGGRVVLTTSEWDSLSTTPISFKVKVEAYENDVSTLVSGPLFNKKLKKLSGSLTPEIEAQCDAQISQLESMMETATPEQVEQIYEQIYSMYGVSSIEELGPFLYFSVEDNVITSIERVYEEPDTSSFTENNIISTDDSIYPIYAWYDNGVIKYYTKTNNIKANSNMFGMFAIMKSLTSIGDLSELDTTNVSNMMRLFSQDSSLTNISFLSNWNTSNVMNMVSMFDGCTGLTNLSALSNWNVSNVIYMTDMFMDCTALSNITGLSNWNVSNVTDMSYMFGGQFNGSTGTAIANVQALSNWNVSNVTDMSYMFNGCSSLTDLNGLLNWNVSNVTSMTGMFQYCTSLRDLSGISSWNVSNVADLMSLFSADAAITNLDDLSNWNTSSVTNMKWAFSACSSLEDASGINNWDISNVTDFTTMFYQTPVHPEFTKRAGTWNNKGTFIPSA